MLPWAWIPLGSFPWTLCRLVRKALFSVDCWPMQRSAQWGLTLDAPRHKLRRVSALSSQPEDSHRLLCAWRHDEEPTRELARCDGDCICCGTSFTNQSMQKVKAKSCTVAQNRRAGMVEPVKRGLVEIDIV